jgi:signal peptidase II
MLALGADQLHKWWMIEIYRIGERGKVELTSFLDLVMVWNPGISYGLWRQHGANGQILLVAIAALAAAALWLWLARLRGALPAIAVGLIIGGAAGNAIDRLRYGAVADFFSFHAAGFYWYIFNIADIAIVAGVIGLLYDSLITGHKKVEKQT